MRKQQKQEGYSDLLPHLSFLKQKIDHKTSLRGVHPTPRGKEHLNLRRHRDSERT